MGFNKRYLPELKDLKERREMLGDNSFFRIYVQNPDCLIGSTESMEYVDAFIKEYECASK